MQLPFWFLSSVGLHAVALVIYALPSHLEGPVLVEVSPGHAIAATDAVATAVLLVAALLLYVGLWRNRAGLGALTRQNPGGAVALSFLAGGGLGLLIASSFSTFFWWWAIGAVLYVAALFSASYLATQVRGAA